MYGENGTLIRAHLDELLRHHRHAQHLAGAPGPGQPRPTPEQTLALVQQCVRYRNTILTWCLQAVGAAAPYAVPAAATPPPDPFSPYAQAHGPLLALRYGLAESVATVTAVSRRAGLDDLTSPHDHRLVECWRQAARGAALAEHDHPTADTERARLTPAQQQALIADVAAITQALVVLDRRNHRQDGWTPLPHPQRLGWAALACAMDAALGPADYSIDTRGWAPRARILRGVPPPGLPGVIHAEHNLLLRLSQLPTALNLRLVADSQRHLSTALSAIGAAHAPTLAAKLTQRADTYSDLRRLLRDIGATSATAISPLPKPPRQSAGSTHSRNLAKSNSAGCTPSTTSSSSSTPVSATSSTKGSGVTPTCRDTRSPNSRSLTAASSPRPARRTPPPLTTAPCL